MRKKSASDRSQHFQHGKSMGYDRESLTIFDSLDSTEPRIKKVYRGEC